jgi:DNA-binding CsgD family transcriptional regulator
VQGASITEADLLPILSIFGRIAGLQSSPTEKRLICLEELCQFFQAQDWGLEEMQAPSAAATEETHRLAATQRGRRLTFRRDESRKPFDEKERMMFALITTRIPWLLDPHSDSNLRRREVRLSPQMQRVLVLVCLGEGRKTIADMLGIQQGTLDGYMRDLYRTLGVRSQTALIRLCAGDCGSLVPAEKPQRKGSKHVCGNR